MKSLFQSHLDRKQRHMGRLNEAIGTMKKWHKEKYREICKENFQLYLKNWIRYSEVIMTRV